MTKILAGLLAATFSLGVLAQTAAPAAPAMKTAPDAAAAAASEAPTPKKKDAAAKKKSKAKAPAATASAAK